MTDTLSLRSAADGWVRVESKQQGDHFVHEVIVAGNEIKVNCGSTVTIEANTWAIQGELYPSLLVEAPEYYNPTERNQERPNDIVFYSSE